MLIICIASIWNFSQLQKLRGDTTVLAGSMEARVAALMESTNYIRTLTEQQVIDLVPQQSGLHYVDCPNCDRGRQENQLQWSPEHPREIQCRFCSHRYPSTQYPENEKVEVRTPLGNKAVYPYWSDSSGYRHFFQAKRDDLVRVYLAQQARDLSLLYTMNHDETVARRAAIILVRFAEVFPDWCFHYDYPFRQKEIYDGVVLPSQFRAGYRTARWTWWAYSDVPVPLIQAYDNLIQSKAMKQLSTERGVDLALKIERDLIRNACDQVLSNEDQLTNMSPTAWRSLIAAGKSIREPTYIHEPVRRLKRFVEKQFFYDGVWCEGSPDYARQSVGGLDQVLELLRGYSDPSGYVDATDGMRFHNLDIGQDFELLKLARESLSKLRLPNGRSVPIHDTWPTSQRGAVEVTKPYLLPALGHACLGGGRQLHQTQFHLTWSGGYGHSHGDNLSLLLFANGHEQLSDLGYTHTAYRSWTLATAAHNTVVIDGINQEMGSKENPTDGTLRFFDASSDRVQVIRASGERAYPNLARKYDRTLIVVRSDENQYYAIDLFEVAGGNQHDYWLHGNADSDTQVNRDGDWKPVKSLLPQGSNWMPTRNEGETGKIKAPYYAYGFVRNLESKRISANQQSTWTSRTVDTASQQGNAINVTLLTNRDGELFVGSNPSIRRADEDDSRLEQFHRPCLMWRQTTQNSEQSSRFLAVMEPINNEQVIKSIREISKPGVNTLLRIQLQNRVDWLVIGASETVDMEFGSRSVSFQGDVGFASDSQSEVGNAHFVYAVQGTWNLGDRRISSQRFEGTLHAIDNRRMTLALSGANLDHPPAIGSTIRLSTEDGWVYPLTVKQCEGKNGNQLSVETAEAMTMEWQQSTKRLLLRSFPQRSHEGIVKVDWIIPKSVEIKR